MTSRPPNKGNLVDLIRRQPSDAEDEPSAFQRISMIYEYMKENRASDSANFDNALLSNLTLISASVIPTPTPSIKTTPKTRTAKSTWRFTVPSTACNGMANLHGGAQATLFDITTSMTVYALSTPEFWTGHVSRTLSTTYILAAPEGETVFIESEVVGLGGTLGVITATMRLADGRVVSVCTHDKVHMKARI